jgi:hypothetical protein
MVTLREYLSAENTVRKYEKEHPKSEKKEVLDIRRYNYRDKEYISIHKSNGNLVKRFQYADNAKPIKGLNNTKYANEKTIRYYYQNKSDDKYEPTTKGEYKEQFKKLEDKKLKQKDIKVFKNENRLIFTHNKNIKNFDYMYINAKVKIFLDGQVVIAYGRSSYIYGRNISDSEEAQALQQAVRRAIAPYGSNLKITMLSWNYVYHQEKYKDFDRRN